MTQVEPRHRTSPAIRIVGIVGLFDSPEPLRRAAERFRDARLHPSRWDCHTPYPVHGLDRAMGVRPSRLGMVTVTGAFVGLGLAMLMTGGLSVFQYPIRIGGKPLWSWQAFMPIFFEMFVLVATVSTLAGLIVLGRLGRWHSPMHDSGVMPEVTCDRFAIVVRGGAGGDASALERARQMLSDCGCRDIRPLIEEA